MATEGVFGKIAFSLKLVICGKVLYKFPGERFKLPQAFIDDDAPLTIQGTWDSVR
jgi:hypothetical protein